MSIEEFEVRLKSLGFSGIKRKIPAQKIFSREYYQDPRFALQTEFRQGDSVYSFLPPEELIKANNRLRKAIGDGSAHRQMKRVAERVEEIGEAVILSARKTS